MDTSFLNDIVSLDFPEDQYYRGVHEKKQIVLHHTASGRGVNGDFRFWLSTPVRVSTCVIIDYKGVINQLYSSKYWGHHLGVKQAFLKKNGISNWREQNRILNKQSVAIEIDAWGGLEYRDGKWYAWPGGFTKEVPADRVIVYDEGYRGFFGYERYTDEQIESVRKLLLFWSEKYSIDLTYNEDMWDVSKSALEGSEGVWSHGSFRLDKSDCHPQTQLVTMLKGLTT